MKDRSAPIGVFDSGIGGLNVLDQCVRRFPHENFCYFGDNGHAPYGGKTVEELQSLLLSAVDLFLREGVKAIVLACNTLSTNCLDWLRPRCPVPVVGTFPAIEEGVRCRRLLILATAATLNSSYCRSHILSRKGETITYFPSDLVADIEKNAPDWENVGINIHFSPQVCDGVVIGCTHFLFLREEISRFYGAPCFDGNKNTLKSLKKILKNDINSQEKSGNVIFIGNSQEQNRTLYRKIFLSL